MIKFFFVPKQTLKCINHLLPYLMDRKISAKWFPLKIIILDRNLKRERTTVFKGLQGVARGEKVSYFRDFLINS